MLKTLQQKRLNIQTRQTCNDSVQIRQTAGFDQVIVGQLNKFNKN
jgi:hypothetical protein